MSSLAYFLMRNLHYYSGIFKKKITGFDRHHQGRAFDTSIKLLPSPRLRRAGRTGKR
jgi:hypothetical protein